MRLFIVACLFGLTVAAVGCATQNWTRPVFGFWKSPAAGESASAEPDGGRWSLERKTGLATGLDREARDIERNLGFR